MKVRRVVIIAAVAGALVGGAVAGGVAAASASGKSSDGSSSNGGASDATTAVVRTTLQSTVQVGGSIGYEGSYVINAPTGASVQQVAQAQQQLTQAQEALANDETLNSYGATADDQALTNAQNSVNAATATLSADETKQAQACAGRGASSPGCGQDAQKVSQDAQQVDQAQQQLASAQLNADRDSQQAHTKIQSDDNQIQSAQSNLTNLEATEASSGGTYTALPKVGDLISEDQPVYAVDGVKVPLLYGSLAAYRAFYVGMSDGADVGQLTHDLIALGYGAGLTPSYHYSSATAAAVQRWQTAIGLPSTGTVLLGEVVFEPGPIRVTSVTPSVGQAVAPGDVLDATSTTPVVTVDLEVTQEYLLKPGDPVTVELPDGVTTVGGVVQSVGNVAVCPGGSGTGNGGNGGNTADQTPCSSSGSGSSSTPTVTVTITLDTTPPGATLDQAPVNVNITTQRADNVLAVPVNALLALQGGGYGVEVVSGGVDRLVGVTTGLYSNTMVQISGAGISAGTLVEVPSS
jgi:multidrug efflux pump subunit AcrA (membrane-fusion protein)